MKKILLTASLFLSCSASLLAQDKANSKKSFQTALTTTNSAASVEKKSEMDLRIAEKRRRYEKLKASKPTSATSGTPTLQSASSKDTDPRAEAKN